MGVFDRPKQQKQAINTIIICMSSALGLMIISLIYQANRLSNVKTEVFGDVNVGPFNLIEIYKIPLTGGGFQASVKILPSILAYIGMWLVLAAAIILIRVKFGDSLLRSKTTSKD